MTEFETKVQERAYLKSQTTASTDEKTNYYAALNEIRAEMLSAIEALYFNIGRIEAEPGGYIYINDQEYIYEIEDFPRDEIRQQIFDCNGNIELRYPSPYYNETGDVRKKVNCECFAVWDFTEESPPKRPDNADRHEAALCTNLGRFGYDSCEERDIVFRYKGVKK